MQTTLYGTIVNLTDANIRECQAKAIFSDKSFEVSQRIEKQYNDYGSLQKVVQYLPDYADKLYAQTAQEVAEKLHQDGIYTVTANDFLERMFRSGRNFSEAMDEVAEELFAYTNQKNLESEYRDFRKESRSRLIGYNLSGMAISGTVNIATGLAHSIFNVIDGALTNSNINSEINAIYKNPQTVEKLRRAASRDIKNMWPLFFEVYGYDPRYDIIFDDKSRRQAISISNNLNENRIPENYIKEAVTQMILKAPYESIFYTAAYKHFGDPDGDSNIVNFAKIFGIELDLNIYDEITDCAKKFLGENFTVVEKTLRGDDYYDTAKVYMGSERGFIMVAQGMYSKYSKKYGEQYFYGVSSNKFQSKVKSAMEEWAKINADEEPIYIYDSTLFGSASEGFLVTQKNVYYNNDDDIGSISIKNIRSIKVIEDTLNVFMINDEIKLLSGGCDLTAMYEIQHLLQVYFYLCNFIPANDPLNRKNNYVKENNAPINKSNQYSQTSTSTSSNVNKKVHTQNDYNQEVAAVKDLMRTICNQREEYNFKSYVYYYGLNAKSDEKINKAIKSYAHLQSGEIPFLCFDSTVMGGADDGLLVTNFGIHIHNPYEDDMPFIPYSEIQSIEVKGFIVKDIYINGIKIYTPGAMSSDDKKNFVAILNGFVNMPSRR